MSKVSTEKMYTTKEASEILNITEYTVRKWIRNGKLTALGDGTRRGYKIQDSVLKEFLAKNNDIYDHVNANYKLENSPWPASLGEARAFAEEELYYDPLSLIQVSRTERNKDVFNSAKHLLEKSIEVLEVKQQLVKEQIALFKKLTVFDEEKQEAIRLITKNSKLELSIAAFKLVLEDVNKGVYDPNYEY